MALRLPCASVSKVLMAGIILGCVCRCHNYTAALGRWSVPISRDDQEMLVCGIDGCF